MPDQVADVGVEIKPCPCPFCGCELILDPNEGAPFWVHPDRLQRDCWLSSAYVLDELEGEGGIREWNIRPPSPLEYLKVALEKARSTLENYADPSSYADSQDEPYDGVGPHPGILAAQTLAEIEVTLSRPSSDTTVERLKEAREAFFNLIADASTWEEQQDEGGIYYKLEFTDSSLVPLMNALGIEQQYGTMMVDDEPFPIMESPAEAIEREINASGDGK